MASSFSFRRLIPSFAAALALVVGLSGFARAEEEVARLRLDAATVVDLGPLTAVVVSPDGSTFAGFTHDEAVIYRNGIRLAATHLKDGYRGVRYGLFDSAGALKFHAVQMTADALPIAVVMAAPKFAYRRTELQPLIGLSCNGEQVALKRKNNAFAIRSFESDADLREFEVEEFDSGRFRGQYHGIRDVAIADDGCRAVARAGYYPHIDCFGEVTEPSRLWVVDGGTIRLVLDESRENKVDLTARFHWEHLALDARGETAVVAGFHESKLGGRSCLRVIPLSNPGRSTLHTFGVDFIRALDLTPDGKRLAIVWRTDGHIFHSEEYRTRRLTVDEARDFVRVYAVDGLKPLAESPPLISIRAAALTRDGNRLTIARTAGQVLTWPLEPSK